MVLNPIAGPDQRPHRRPARPAPAVAAAGRAGPGGRLRADLRRADDGLVGARGRRGCWSSSWPARRRTRSSRCRTSRCRPRSPSSYDERTRLMTWRVAILAFTIMLAGATAPLIRDAVGGRDGYRVMGVVMAALIVVGVSAPTVGTRRAPTGTVVPGAGQPARPAADRGRRPRLPAAADDVRAPGAGHRLHAGRRRLPRHRRARAEGRGRRSSSSASSGRPCC